jgi:hypothetical protein
MPVTETLMTAEELLQMPADGSLTRPLNAVLALRRGTSGRDTHHT